MQTTHHTALFTHPQTTDHSLPPTDNGSFSTLPQITPITQIKHCGSARGYCPQGFKP